MFQMGGLWRKLPVAFWTFLIGAIALAGLPPVTSGFASKDAILYWVYKGPHGMAHCIAGIVGAGLTSLYTFRMVFLTFFGPLRHTPSRGAGAWMGVPLVLLAAGCGVAGLLDWPENLGGHAALSHFLSSTFGGEATPESSGVARAIQVAATAASLVGLVLAYMFVLRRPAWAEKFLAAPAVQRVRQAWLSGWGFDALYEKLFVRPVLSAAHFLRDDPVDRVFQAAADACELGHRTLIRTQNGRVRWYAMGIAAGAIVILAILVLA
jgi:NADH-quinone oxidoreductase subunit L